MYEIIHMYWLSGFCSPLPAVGYGTVGYGTKSLCMYVSCMFGFYEESSSEKS